MKGMETTHRTSAHAGDEALERVRMKRRGHWRLQHYGPDRSLVKRMRIKPYYITVWRPRSTNYELPLG